MVYFISDTHWGHKNILQYANRPFSSVEEMDQKLIENWNNTVGPEDVVYHLGDFSFGSDQRVGAILNQLNFGHLYLIKGNHEKPFCNYMRFNNPNRVSLCNSYMEITTEGEFFVLSHYPILEWNKCHRGAYHCYGHVHNKVLPEINKYRAIDVGVDAQGYKPISASEVIKKLNNRKVKAHHD